MAPVSPCGNAILAVNSGSSSLKFGLYRPAQGDPELVLAGGATGIGRSNGNLQIKDSSGNKLLDEAYNLSSQGEAMKEILDFIAKHAGARPDAVGHRMVHGGPHLREHQRVTPDLLR
ncbi:MAG TPA: hypothetical protein VJS11_08650, partial [Acidobacteriaceae bacterium]|nr:hypothetical protein [Acidobacteriaceae bacterium]